MGQVIYYDGSPAISALVGKEFNRWVVVSYGGRGAGTAMPVLLNCVCECGKTGTVSYTALKMGTSRSCGCYNSEMSTLKNTQHGQASPGKAGNGYYIWQNLVQRCTNPKNTNYKYYGARGIVVCDKWLLGFKYFLEDMGLRPSKKHTIEREDPDGMYCKENCSWKTMREQSRNKSSNVWHEHNGRRMIIADWAAELRVGRCTLESYLERHSFAEAFYHYTNKAKLGV